MSINLTVDLVEFRNQMRTAAKLAGRFSGNSVWTFHADRMEVQWGGALFELSGKGAGKGIIQVRKADMKGIPQLLRGDGTLVLAVDGDRLLVGTTSIQVILQQVAPTPDGPQVTVNAKYWDILMLAYQNDPADITRMGMREVVDAANERKQAMVGRAAAELAALKITPELLLRWVDAHLAACADGKETFEIGRTVVVDAKTGQARLFGRGA